MIVLKMKLFRIKKMKIQKFNLKLKLIINKWI